MSTLVLELRQGDLLVVNGAPLRFRNRARIELTSRARFLFGKQIMTPEAASTPARRIYFAIQTAYIGNEEERERGLELARDLVAEFQQATTSTMVRDMLDSALALAEQDECYQALKLIRRIMQHEDAVLQGSPPTLDSANPAPAPRPSGPAPGTGAMA
ncbi:flagellar biosynthesis repressor FlbT [Roseomonas sp. GC11]|uniref:flagellar biosynthesis repressor FlbT n=1 Tax=Roseomonas sp. GC11 TaxID=2950546 RepID=UPI00210A8253|nr:flagellar biosynthesis repressor FlbT [Roseomonas sp. GC11]MCQ4161044.1 flagellar biosynthesis repressor FlbT [Roseomonas sp. GC11]